MRAEIKNIHSQTGATTVYVTHDQVEGQTMANRIVVINKGFIEQLASPKTIYNRPANLFVADFIGSPAINLIEGTVVAEGSGNAEKIAVKNDLFTLTTAYQDLKAGLEVVAAIRPENISVVPEPGTNTIAGTVDTVLPTGPETILRARHDGMMFNILVTKEIDVMPGQEIHMYIPPEHILIFDRQTSCLLPL